MSSGSSRPGGLTALAILNFIFGGISALLLLGTMALFGLAAGAGADVGGELAKGPGTVAIIIGLVLGVINMFLLIISGIGYLGLKKVMGRVLGSVYGFLAIVGGIVNQVLLEQPFGIMTLVGFIYPGLTLILLNTTFKNDFINA